MEYFDSLRAREFSRLDEGGHVYLDHTGSGLHAESQIRAHTRFLERCVLGNPHSRNPTSSACTDIVERARDRVRRFFGAPDAEYEVVFTPNATGALKLVGESFPFGPLSRCVLTADNHNSVHGIREFARSKGADLVYIPPDEELRVPDPEPYLEDGAGGGPHLFVYPAKSNFSGVIHPLEWIERARDRGYRVFLDAAAFAPTHRLSLGEARPDFVAVAFYKMFGFPTGVGALIARREALAELRRPWFGGGTVRFVSVRSGVRLLYPTGRGFEDGTPNFLGIAAVTEGLDFLEEVGMERIEDHLRGLTGTLLRRMAALEHESGAPLLRIYGPQTAEARGGTIAFNVLDRRGRAIDFREVERRAAERRISIRTGYFCNPGAAEHAFGHRGEEVERCSGGETAESFDIERFALCMNPESNGAASTPGESPLTVERPVGGVRVSLGIASNEADIDAFIELLQSFRQPHQEGTSMPAEAPAR